MRYKFYSRRYIWSSSHIETKKFSCYGPIQFLSPSSSLVASSMKRTLSSLRYNLYKLFTFHSSPASLFPPVTDSFSLPLFHVILSLNFSSILVLCFVWYFSFLFFFLKLLFWFFSWYHPCQSLSASSRNWYWLFTCKFLVFGPLVWSLH